MPASANARTHEQLNSWRHDVNANANANSTQPADRQPTDSKPRNQARRNVHYASRLSAGEALQSVRCTTQELVQYKEVPGGPSRVPPPDNYSQSQNYTMHQTNDENQLGAGHQRHRLQDRRKLKHGDEAYWLRKSLEGSSRRNASPRRGKITNGEVACHLCHRLNSPEWRDGPDGPGTLCNVCGLIYAKREAHRRSGA